MQWFYCTPLPLVQALPCLSTRACLTVVFQTALLGFLLLALPCLSTGTPLTVVFLTFSMLAQGEGGIRCCSAEYWLRYSHEKLLSHEDVFRKLPYSMDMQHFLICR